MKYLNKVIVVLALCAGCITSCKDDDNAGVAGGLLTDKEEIAIGPEGGVEKISVLSNISWVASASKAWITVSPANGLGAADCQLAIDSTLENTARTAQIRFSSDNAEQKLITITQFGFGKQILLNEPNVEIASSDSYNKRVFDLVVSTNVACKLDVDHIEYSFADAETMTEEEKVEYESEREGWLANIRSINLDVDLDRKARPRTAKAQVRWEMNTAPFTRVAKIYLVPKDPEKDKLVDDEGNELEGNRVVLTVTQKPALKIEDNRAGDSLAVITINEKVQSMINFNTSENMQNWENLTLWEETDENLPGPEAIGRVRSVSFIMIDMKEGEVLPKEIRYLKYLESFSIRSNANSQIRIIGLGEEICELKYLKHLVLYSYGINKLPDNFQKLGGAVDTSYRGLETLSLAATNFAKLTDITKGTREAGYQNGVNKANFPKLTSLALNGMRRTDSFKDLTQVTDGDKYNGNPIGLFVNIKKQAEQREAFMELLMWDNLRELSLAYNFIEGELPTDEELETYMDGKGIRAHYDESDFSNDKAEYLDKLVGDTCRWLLTNKPVIFKHVVGETEEEEEVRGEQILRVLPRMRYFAINLNFLTGKLPNWILFHPYFAGWGPEISILLQQEGGMNTAGNVVGFNNVDSENFDFTYYYGDKDWGHDLDQGVAYPLYYRRYVANNSSADGE